VPGIYDKDKVYLNPGLIKFTEMFFAKNADHLKKCKAKFPVCDGKTEMHPELLAFIATLVSITLFLNPASGYYQHSWYI